MPEPTGFLLLVCRFKNERHILYEYVHHYLAEGVDHILLVDDNSDDDYLEYNKWLDRLVDQQKVTIKSPLTGTQSGDYGSLMPFIKKFEWVLVVDADEFVFCPQPNKTLKDILKTTYADVDQIRFRWRLFTHHARLQPKSVIATTLWTHTSDWDTSSPNSEGYKCVAKTASLTHIDIHYMEFSKQNLIIEDLKNCHNGILLNNHYRTQSEEFLRGVKELKGGGVHKGKYQNFRRHLDFKYEKECTLLKEKCAALISRLNKKEQVRPKIHPDSSFAKELQDLGDGFMEANSVSSSNTGTTTIEKRVSDSMGGEPASEIAVTSSV